MTLPEILKLVSFYDSNRARKFLVHYATDKDEQGVSRRSIYLADTTLDWQSAIKIIDLDVEGIGNSPFVSYGDHLMSEKKYIVIERIGPGDTQDLTIADENGNLLAEYLIRFKNPELIGYFVSFDRWDSPNTFWAKASSYDAGHPSLKLLVDAQTGRIIENFELCTESQNLKSKVRTP